MESQNNLDTNGNLRINPLADLLAEIAQIKLNGALRLTNEKRKIAVYFDAGEVIFAVSNARQHRLFEMLLQTGALTEEQLAAIPKFTDDSALKENLLANDSFETREINALVSRQISEVLKTALAWRDGEWTFSPLVRIKGDIRFPVDLKNMLIEHTRSLPLPEISRKFSNSEESIWAKFALPADVALSPHESFVFSRFENAELTINKIQSLSGLPEAETQRIVYALWLGGLVERENWNAAFTEKKISAILSARLTLKKDEQSAAALPVVLPPPVKAEKPPKDLSETESASTDAPLLLDEYLDRIEKATNFYEIFALPLDAAVADVKRAYFGMAKRFHPDLYYKEPNAKLLQRIQAAFTKLAHAYDTLKTESSRDVYNFKMRKELAEIKAVQAAETTPEEIAEEKQIDQAEENFARGLGILMDGYPDAALPFLARAVHFAKGNARYHAYYGKALAADSKQRHKAESELQTAVKLDGENTDYRIMLAEFFIQFNLFKRAEGELNRLLTIFPSNYEAQRLLDSLTKK